MTEKTTLIYEITRPEPVITPPTRITVPSSSDGPISFAHPYSGPNTYQKVGKSILDNKTADLVLPTGVQTSDLIHATYLGPTEFQAQSESVELRDNIMRNNYVWVFNRNLWTSEDAPRGQGVYVQHDAQAKGLNERLDIEDLERELHEGEEIQGVTFSKDGKTVFAPRESYELGDHTPESFAKDGFVVANFGFDGAEKLSQVSTKFKHDPRTWGLDIKKGQKAEQRVSAVDVYDGRLSLYGDYSGDSWGGLASGVFG
jgi:hypothetical protein